MKYALTISRVGFAIGLGMAQGKAMFDQFWNFDSLYFLFFQYQLFVALVMKDQKIAPIPLNKKEIDNCWFRITNLAFIEWKRCFKITFYHFRTKTLEIITQTRLRLKSFSWVSKLKMPKKCLLDSNDCKQTPCKNKQCGQNWCFNTKWVFFDLSMVCKILGWCFH